MRVSVIIPCYNAGPYLAQAIGSVLDQDSPPDEIIIVDDGSTDGSLALARRFEATAPDRIRVSQERSGRAARTRNIGALLATGDALVFLDADDVIRPDTIAALAGALKGNRQGVAICPWFRLVQHRDRWVERPPSCAPRQPGQDALSAWLTGWYHPPCSVMWSRTAFEATGRWDESLSSNDDGDLMMRALAIGVPLAEARAGAGYYRRRADGQQSLSEKRFTRHSLLDRIRIVRKVALLLRERRRLEPYRPALSQAFLLIARDADQEPDLASRARSLARYYRPSAARRLTAGLAGTAKRSFRPSDTVAGSAARLEPEVRWGLERAEITLLRAAPDRRAQTAVPRRPLVTVIIPTFNRAHLLPRAIDSVLGQTFTDIELIVVDDGSTDSTPAIADRYRDPRVQYRPQSNAGVSAARNRGLREARGDLVAFLDSDDEWMADKLARQVALIQHLPEEVGLVYTGVESVRADGRRTIERATERGDVYRQMLWRNVIHGGGSNVMMRRNVVATVGFFHEGLSAIEDYEYWLRVTRFFRVDCIEDPLIRYYDPPARERRSQAVRANLETREWFFRKHAAEMRRARVAHLFLLKSMRRALKAQEPDVRAARRLALRAVREAPISRDALAGLLMAMRPRAGVRERGT